MGDDLDYMHARFCSPVVGRFWGVDSVGGKPTAPQTWNRYSYALGTPLKYLDANGREVRLGNGPTQTLAAMRLMVPGAVRSAISMKVGRSGDMEVAIKGGTHSNDINFKNLQRAVNSPGIVTINQTGPNETFLYRRNGETLQASLTAVNPGLKGVTLPTDGTAGGTTIRSPNSGVIEVHIDASLSSRDQAPVLAAELAGHALPGLLGEGAKPSTNEEHLAREDPAVDAAKKNRDQPNPPG